MESDWKCKCCEYVNHSYRNQCRQCDYKYHPSTAVKVTTSGPIGSKVYDLAHISNDWHCIHCNYRNFKDRKYCKRCSREK